MPSSTSSSEQAGLGLPGAGLGPAASLGLALLASLVAIAAVAWFRPDHANPVDDLSFFRMKLAWRAEADAVVIGNSQVYRGVDPAGIRRTCPGLQALNFGFSGVLMRPDYIESGLNALRPEGPRLLLVGINPLQFKDPKHSDGFVETRRHDGQFRLPWRFEAFMQPLLSRLRPLEQPLPAARLVRWQYRPDGFVASDSPPMEIRSSRYERYRGDYRARPFSHAMYQAMLRQLAALQDAGVRVMVFATYSSPAFEAIDAEMTGLDDARLAADLRRHGLTYLPVATDGLRSYDGTHLDAASAFEFSERLGRAIHAGGGASACAANRTGAADG